MTTKRFWTEREIAYLLAQYGKIETKEIAKKLRRSIGSVHQCADRHGLSKKRDKAKSLKLQRRIREMNASGLRDSEISDILGVNRRSVAWLRKKQGLPAIGRNESYRRMVAEKTKQQCRQAGVKNLAELRSLEMKRIAKKLGWPETLSVRAVQILETLYRYGPMTRKQLAAAIGIPWAGSRKTFSNNRVPGQSYTAELMRAGLVIRLDSAICHAGRGNHEDVYMVALGVEPCRRKRD